MNLVSLTNIDILLSYGPKISKNTNYAIYGHTFLVITQAENCYGETIIYRMVIKNSGSGLNCHFRFFGS